MNRLNPHRVGSMQYLAWDRGWRAQRNGLPLVANAYVQKYGQLARWSAWRSGWLAARDEQRAMSNEQRERGGVSW